MGIPALLFLAVYLVVIFILLIFTIFNIYHVVRYALKTKVSVFLTVMFITGLVLILGFSLYAMVQIDWLQTFYFSIF